MTTPQKRKGYSAEKAVADYLNGLGIPCERIPSGATADRGDLWVPIIEFPTIDVKNHASLSLAEWVDRAADQAHNAGRRAGVVWHKRPRKADPSAWYVTTSGEMFLRLMEIR